MALQNDAGESRVIAHLDRLSAQITNAKKTTPNQANGTDKRLGEKADEIQAGAIS